MLLSISHCFVHTGWHDQGKLHVHLKDVDDCFLETLKYTHQMNFALFDNFLFVVFLISQSTRQ
jgi:hypothetical protein